MPIFCRVLGTPGTVFSEQNKIQHLQKSGESAIAPRLFYFTSILFYFYFILLLFYSSFCAVSESVVHITFPLSDLELYTALISMPV